MKVSNGYIMGFLCGYLKDKMDPSVFGYHRGYTMNKTAAEGKLVEPAKPQEPCKCGKPKCGCKPQAPQKVG